VERARTHLTARSSHLFTIVKQPSAKKANALLVPHFTRAGENPSFFSPRTREVWRAEQALNKMMALDAT